MIDYNQKLGKSKVMDIVTSSHNGYIYDMPVISHTRKNYTTFTTTSLLFDISNARIEVNDR